MNATGPNTLYKPASKPCSKSIPDANHQFLKLGSVESQECCVFTNSQSQPLLHLVSNLSLILGPALAPHLSSLDISRALVIRLGKHAHDRDEDLLYALDRRPALRSMLVMVRVIAGRMEDRNADSPVGIDYDRLAEIRHLSVSGDTYRWDARCLRR